MKKLTISRLFASSMIALGTFAMLSLSSCAGGGQSDQDAEQTEEAAPADDMKEEAEHPTETEAAIDTAGHDHDHDEEHEEHPEGGDEHPSGGSEHPN